MNEEKILKHVAIYSLILMICVVIFSVGIKYPTESISYASEITKAPTPTIMMKTVQVEQKMEKEEIVKNTVEEDVYSKLPNTISKEMIEQLGDNFIAISKPETLDTDYTFTLEEFSVDRSIKIRITGIATNSILENDVHRVYYNNYHCGTIASVSPVPSVVPEEDEIEENIESVAQTDEQPNKFLEETPIETLTPTPEPKDLVTNLEVEYTTLDDGTIEVTLTMDLIKTYAYILDEDENYFLISFVNPHDIYDKIVVLDAGHGGNDSGTYSSDFKYLEKTMNLDMMLKLSDLLSENEEIKVYLTRTTDRKLTLNQRVNLANDVEADLFLSIHCNANLSKKINGTEVLYNDKQNSWNGFNSKEFARICQDELVSAIGLKDRGLVPRSHDVHIIGEAKVPVALVEVAFMSNKGDMNFLKEEDNRAKAAQGLYTAIIRALEIKEQEVR